MERFTVLHFLEEKKISEASLGILQSGCRKLCFRVEATERSSCNRWDMRLCVCGGKRWRKQAICLLLFSVTRKMSTFPSDKEGLQPRTCHSSSEKQLLPIQVTMHLIFTVIWLQDNESVISLECLSIEFLCEDISNFNNTSVL